MGGITNSTAFNIADGATIIIPDNIYVFQGTGAVAGLKEARPEWFSPTVVGASDDTDAIQKAGDALVEYGKLILDKNYVASKTGIGVDFNGRANFTVCGSGVVTTPASALSSRPFVIRNSSFVEVYGVTFKCLIPLGASAQPCNGLDVMNTTDAYIHDCKFIGQTFYGLGVYEDTIGVTDGSCAGLRVTDNLFQDIGTLGLEPFPKVIAGTALIARNKFVNCGNNKVGTGNAGAFKAGNGFETVVVEDNIIDNCGGSALGYGVGIAGWSDITFTGNKFYRCKINIAVSTGAHTLGEESTFLRLIIAKNMFGTTTSNNSMIVITHLSGVPYDTSGGSIIIDDNEFLSNNTASINGIESRGAGALKDLFILNNKFRGIATYPINLNNADGGSFVNPVISNNTFIATSATRIISDIKIDNSDSGIVQGNTHINSGEYALRITNATGTFHIIANKYINGNVTSIASRAAITTIGTSVATYLLGENVISGGSWAALVLSASANHTLQHSKNIAPKLATNSTPTVVATEMMGAITANADAAITGYITITDQVGVSRKLAVIN